MNLAKLITTVVATAIYTSLWWGFLTGVFDVGAAVFIVLFTAVICIFIGDYIIKHWDD